ncbi:myeloid-associated differentiation marker-like [Acomys russatus]|uniref:myeloid-associated differentiation marker-like n=1 Tax=Acomys russatus TaxID=60746 RepID=UPI0021E303CC|nr:myeloid-associated differentiation marker-like [Acomys russatus]
MADTPVKVTRTVITNSVTPGLESLTIVGSPRVLVRPLGLIRLLQLSSTCLAFSLVLYVGAWKGTLGSWCLFSWCFCFAMTLMVLSVELTRLQRRYAKSWLEFPITCACYGFLFSLSSSIIYSTTYVRFMAYGYPRTQAIRATVISCVSCVAYATEVTWTLARPGEIPSYMATVSGLLKIVESFVGCLIFVFINNPQLYMHISALEWCVGVYIICFILTMVAILLNLGHCIIPFPTFLTSIAFLSVLLYTTAIVLWPVYQFGEGFGISSNHLMGLNCHYRTPYSVCNWDRQVAVAVLTGINLLAYIADFIYSK